MDILFRFKNTFGVGIGVGGITFIQISKHCIYGMISYCYLLVYCEIRL